MRRIAAAATAIICAAGLVACSGQDDDQASSADPSASEVVETPEESATPEDTATPKETASDPASDPSMPGSIEELAAMTQAMIEESGMSEVTVGDVAITMNYSARGSALVITGTFDSDVELPDDTSGFAAAVEPMVTPMIETLLPTVREIDPEATVIVEYVQANGEVIYSLASE